MSERAITCRECGQKAMQSLCFTCNFWTDRAAWATDPKSVVIDGWAYAIAPESDPGMRGFGGRRFVIRFRDGREVTTTNLWTQGEIPERFRNRLPDNAEWVKP